MRRTMRNGIRKIAAFIRVQDNKRGVDAATCSQLGGKGDGMIADTAARGLEPRNHLNEATISCHVHKNSGAKMARADCRRALLRFLHELVDLPLCPALLTAHCFKPQRLPQQRPQQFSIAFLHRQIGPKQIVYRPCASPDLA